MIKTDAEKLRVGDVLRRPCDCFYRVSAIAPVRLAHIISCNQAFEEGELIEVTETALELGRYALVDPLEAALIDSFSAGG